MKKTLIGLFASIALVLGFGAIGSSATAAAYPSTVPTAVFAIRADGTTEGTTFQLQLTVNGGNAVVTDGIVTVVFGGVKTNATIVNGFAQIGIKAPGVNKNKFKTLKAYYKPVAGSIFKPSLTSTKIYVRNS